MPAKKTKEEAKKTNPISDKLEGLCELQDVDSKIDKLKILRGELPLEALEHADAYTAAKFLGDINPSSYQSFNLIIADNTNAFWLSSNVETSHVIVKPIPHSF